MAGWHHQCNGHELGQTSGDGGGQRGMEYSLHPLSLMASMPFFILTIPSRVYSPSEEQLLPISLLNSGLEGVLLPPHP